MDLVHEPNSRPWISKLMKPKEILDKYSEHVEKQKPRITLNKDNEARYLPEMTCHTDDPGMFEELEATMDLENLTIEGEAPPMQVVNPNWNGGVYSAKFPKFVVTNIPEEGRLSLKSLYLQADFMKRGLKNDKLLFNRRRELVEGSDNHFLSQPKLPSVYNPKFSDVEHLYVVRVYRPILHPKIAYTHRSHREMFYDKEIWCLGENTLDQLRDLITCPNDNNFVGYQQVDTLNKLAPRAGDVYKSSFLYIGDCFYIDTRDKNNIDLSETIIQWARDRPKGGIGPFKKGVMEDTKFDDLEIRIGQPYVFNHLGNHEHLLVFNDVRLAGPEDPQKAEHYPLVRSIGTQQSRMCMVCNIKIATWVTLNNKRVGENPFFFCSLCYKSFNIKKDGTKECDFEEYRYHDINSV